MRFSRILPVLGIFVVGACGGGGGNGGSNTNGNPTAPPPAGATNGTFTAQINGVNWTAIGTVSVTRQPPSFIGIGASGYAGNTAYALVLGIGNATGPGTHSFNVFAGGDGSSLIIGGQVTGWGTAFQGGSGSVTITSLTSNRIVGTFTGTAVPSSAGSGAGNLAVANGRFDLTF